jgi:hypothetical protein
MIRARRAIAASFVGAVACTGVWTVLPGLPRACAAGQLHVAVVVDFGDNGAGVSSVCVPASAHDNGATVLAARASMLGTPQPRFNASGLLCAIDGVPATGCGEPVGKKYAYWSYWHGDGGWSYSDVGPAASRVDASVVEGWRWNSMGAGNPTDPAPRGSANASATCTQPGRHRRRQRRRLPVAVREQDGDRLAVVHPLAGQALVADDTERVEVARGGRRLTRDLLGRQVVRRTEQ